MRSIPRLCALLGAALACLALPAGTALAGGWVLPATPLTGSANGPSGAVVAVDPSGDAIAAWTDDDGRGTQSVVVASRPAGGTWSAPTTLASDVGVDAPAVTMDAAGNATVLWVESADGTSWSARASRRDAASGSWDLVPHGFAAQGVADPLTQVRADAAGNVYAAWVEHDAGIGFVRAAVLPSGGTWNAPSTLSDPASMSAYGRPQIAPDAAGGALVGWSARQVDVPQGYAVETSAYAGGGSWAAPADPLPAQAEEIDDLRVVGLDGGDAAASWFQGATPTLWGALRASGSWGIEQVSADVATTGCQLVQALAADAGGATVAWEPQSSLGLDSVRLTAAGWEPRTPIFPDSATSDETVSDAALDHGTVVLVAHDVAAGTDSVLASRRQDDGTWTRPAAQLDGGTSATTSLGGLDLATDAAGDALASWTALDGSGGTSVAAAVFQAGAPQLSAVSVPASGTAGTPIAVSASARSTLAGVPQVAWSFGDGSAPVAGSSASHAYASAGTYAVTVTASDGVGGATQATRQVTVAAAPTVGTPPSRPKLGALLRPRIGGARHGVLVLGRGSRTLKLVVRNPNAVRLRGSATLVRPGHGRRIHTLTLVRLRTVVLAAGRRATLTLRLSDPALRALRAASGFRLPVRFTLALRAADGRRVSATLTATLDASARFGAGRLVRVRGGARIAC